MKFEIYTKKPVDVCALKWDGDFDEFKEAFKSVIRAYLFQRRKIYYNYNDESLHIYTLEGDMKANLGDYIIIGIKGEMYPCKPDIFEETYIKKLETDLPLI